MRTAVAFTVLLAAPLAYGARAPGDFNSQLANVNQVVWVESPQEPPKALIQRFERHDDQWVAVGDSMPAVVGYRGYADPGEKREGDKKSPTGIFAIDFAFGYAARIPTRLAYRQSTGDDKVIDDVDSPDYNTWVHGPTTAKSFEKMRRQDGLYEAGFWMHYNRDPVVKGRGSALFFHVWRRPQSVTTGCVATSKENMLTLLEWLDPAQNPRVILNPDGL